MYVLGFEEVNKQIRPNVWISSILHIKRAIAFYKSKCLNDIIKGIEDDQKFIFYDSFRKL